MSPDTILTFLVASALLSLAPGPDNLFVLAQSALYGKRAGILITLGLCTGLIFHTLAVALGVAAIFAVSAIAFTALKVCGAAYLLYLAWQAFKTSSCVDKNITSLKLSGYQFYKRGIIMNMTNPKVAIFFLAFLPQFASPESSSITLQLVLLGMLFIVVALIVFSIIALLSAHLAVYLKKSQKAHIWLNRTAATIFALLAARLLFVSR